MTASGRWHAIVAAYIAFLQRWRWLSALLCLALLVGSAVLAPRLLSATTSAYKPPVDTQADKANNLLGEYFPGLAQSCSLGILIELVNTSKVTWRVVPPEGSVTHPWWRCACDCNGQKQQCQMRRLLPARVCLHAAHPVAGVAAIRVGDEQDGVVVSARPR